MKIEAKDLRIGNYREENSISIPREDIYSVLADGKAFSSITIEGIRLVEEGLLEFNPIRITEEWLFRFGFKKVKGIFEGDFCYRIPTCARYEDPSMFYEFRFGDYPKTNPNCGTMMIRHEETEFWACPDDLL